ncbi:hypothetical protein CKO_00114 [Citrobacter koseri ATCC BAA-895]|uniref:Uncharacterized protein n=1 Tax=Citrobacter koseri (strain ATCC BAA-895 / CDC 4225-83 / SGSC4696) TaxID=290338 RepID=A8ACS6_CITK8|nr:hypothetical protein CKO_00114 [Citrobacter koseri ATCC BAA-895]
MPDGQIECFFASLPKSAPFLICSRRSSASFSSFTRICSAAAVFAIISLSCLKGCPPLYHSLGRRTYTLRHRRTDVPPGLMNREMNDTFIRHIPSATGQPSCLSISGER